MARNQSVRGISSYQTGRQLPDDQIIHFSPHSQVSGCNVVDVDVMVLTGCGLDSRKNRCDRRNFCAGFFKKLTAVQMDWEVGVLYSLRVVNLICTRCVTVRWV